LSAQTQDQRPHYLIVTLFMGSGMWAAWHFGPLVSVLALVAAVIVAFTGSYPGASTTSCSA
jgi:hypothetical protein